MRYLLLLLLLVGCEHKALHVSGTNNVEYQVGFLFEHDGCKVYRFYDEGHRYFVKCENGSTSTHRNVSCGKNCVRPEDIQTEVPK